MDTLKKKVRSVIGPSVAKGLAFATLISGYLHSYGDHSMLTAFYGTGYH